MHLASTISHVSSFLATLVLTKINNFAKLATNTMRQKFWAKLNLYQYAELGKAQIAQKKGLIISIFMYLADKFCRVSQRKISHFQALTYKFFFKEVMYSVTVWALKKSEF